MEDSGRLWTSRNKTSCSNIVSCTLTGRGSFQEASIVEAQTDITAFVAAYADCPDFQKVYDGIKGLQYQETHDTWPDYSINESGLLMHRDGDNFRVCVPSSQRSLILRVMHDLPLGMHQGTARMYALMAARFEAYLVPRKFPYVDLMWLLSTSLVGSPRLKPVSMPSSYLQIV